MFLYYGKITVMHDLLWFIALTHSLMHPSTEQAAHIVQEEASQKRVIPSQEKSGMATSCIGISFRKAGFWQRGFPLTTLVFLSHSPSQAK